MSSRRLCSSLAGLVSNKGQSRTSAREICSFWDPVLEMIGSARFLPFIFHWNNRIQVLCKTGKADIDLLHHLQVLVEFKPSTWSHPYAGTCVRSEVWPSNWRTQPSTSALNCLIGGLCNSEMEDDAKSLLVEMLDHDLLPDDQSLSNLVNVLFNKGKVEQALEVLEMIVRRREFCFTASFNMMLDGYFRIGKIEEALSLYSNMDVVKGIIKYAVRPNQATYSIMIDGLTKNGCLDMAVHSLLKMRYIFVSPDAAVCNSLLDTLCKQGCVEKADQVLLTMMDINVVPDVFVFGSLIDGLLKNGHLGKAQARFIRMLDYFASPAARSFPLIRALIKEGYVDKAKEFYLRISSGDISLCANGVNKLFVIFDDPGNDEAEAVLKSATESYALKGFADCDTIFENLCKKGSLDKAILVLEVMLGECECPVAVWCSSLITSLCKEGRFCDALDVFTMIENRGYECDAVAYNTLMDEYCKEGMFEDAFSMLLEMEDKGFSPDVVYLNTLICGFARQKEGARVTLLLEKMHAMKISPDLNTKCILSECMNMDEDSDFPSGGNPIIDDTKC